VIFLLYKNCIIYPIRQTTTCATFLQSDRRCVRMKQIAISRRWRESRVGYKSAERCDVDTRVCLQTLAGRGQRIHGEIVSRIYSGPWTTMVAKREGRTACAGIRSQFNLPTTRVCLAVIISGVSVNVFRAYLPPSLLAERTVNTRSFTIDRDAHTRTRRMHTRRWRSRSPVRGRDRSSPLAGSVPEIISFAAKRTRTIPWHRSLDFGIAFSSDASEIFPFPRHTCNMIPRITPFFLRGRWNTRLSTPPDCRFVGFYGGFVNHARNLYDYVFIRSNIYTYLRFH